MGPWVIVYSFLILLGFVVVVVLAPVAVVVAAVLGVHGVAIRVSMVSMCALTLESGVTTSIIHTYTRIRTSTYTHIHTRTHTYTHTHTIACKHTQDCYSARWEGNGFSDHLMGQHAIAIGSTQSSEGPQVPREQGGLKGTPRAP